MSLRSLSKFVSSDSPMTETLVAWVGRLLSGPTSFPTRQAWRSSSCWPWRILGGKIGLVWTRSCWEHSQTSPGELGWLQAISSRTGIVEPCGPRSRRHDSEGVPMMGLSGDETRLLPPER